MKNYILLLNVLSLGFFCCAHVVLASDAFADQIAVNRAISIDLAPSKLPVIELTPTNRSYKTIESEISYLKGLKNKRGEVSLDDNKNVAPTLYKTVKEIAEKFVQKTKLEMPELVLCVSDDNRTYNASANSASTIHVKTTKMIHGKKVETTVKRWVETERRLMLGEGTVKLLLWKNYGDKLLSAIIGHEIGHMCDPDLKESKQAEYFADSKAVEFVGKSDARYLTQAIDMITLASHIYNILATNSGLLCLNCGDSHQIIRIIVNSMVNELPELGDLGKCSTHKKFGYVVNKVFQDSLKYSLDPKVGMSEKDFINVYQHLQKACSNLSGYMGDEEDEEISQKFEFIENYTNQLYNNITHPTPLERTTNIEQCIARLA